MFLVLLFILSPLFVAAILYYGWVFLCWPDFVTDVVLWILVIWIVFILHATA